MKTPDKERNVILVTLSHKYIVVVIYLLAFFWFDEKIINLVAVSIVGFLINKQIGLTHLSIIDSKLINIENKVQVVFTKFPSFISVGDAIKNEAQDTDSLVPFDRK